MTPTSALPYPCVVFDLDGTLLDTRDAMVDEINRVLVEIGRDTIGEHQLRRATHQGMPAMLLAALKAGGPLPPPGMLRNLQSLLRQRYLDAAASAVRCFADARPLLEILCERRAWLAICSNQEEAIVRGLLDTFDLSGFFREVVGGDSLPRRKPDPYPLRWLMNAAGSSPSASVLVGDSEVDARCAARSGAAAVIMAHGYGGTAIASPHQSMSDFAALRAVLAP